MEDSLIVDLYFERNEQAIAETQNKYGRLCTKIAAGILKRYEDAEEAVSSSYIKLWNAIPPKRPESLCGYLCRIVRNTALNICDSMKRRSCEELYGTCGGDSRHGGGRGTRGLPGNNAAPQRLSALLQAEKP